MSDPKLCTTYVRKEVVNILKCLQKKLIGKFCAGTFQVREIDFFRNNN